MQPTVKEVDVVVVGAGFSGLTAASELARKGLNVIILEASARVGGRVNPVTTTLGSHIDLGGQWIGHGHRRISALVKKANGTPYPTFTRGLPHIIRENKILPAYSPSVILAVIYLLFLEFSSRLFVPSSWINITVDKAIATWMPLEATRQLLHLLIGITSTAESAKYSIDSFAKTIAHCGGLFAMLGTKGGAQDGLVVESMGVATNMLSDELGSSILTDMTVTKVSQADQAVVNVQTASGQKFEAKKVIITVPPPMRNKITFEPTLPAQHQALQQNTQMGIVYKAIAIYEKPFWRDGMGGEFLILDDPACGVFDSSCPDGPGHLCFLVAGTPARQLDKLDSESRQEFLLSRLVPHLGSAVCHPVDWHEKAWHQDEYCGGGYLAFPLVGTTEGLLPMPHKPVHNIHWAGTETAQDHPGYIEGALQSGERAAAEVIEALV